MQKQTVRMMLVLTLGFLPLSMAQAQGLTLGEALDAPELTWTTEGPWVPQTHTTYDGIDAVEIDFSNYYMGWGWIQTTVTGPTAVAFWWNCTNDGTFEFGVRGSPQLKRLHESTGWHYVAYAVPAGTNTLWWTFHGGHGAMAWLDQVVLQPLATGIEILGTNSAVISNGTATTSTTNGTDFGAALLTGRTATRTFRIHNPGTLDLQVSSVTAGGEHAADFEVLSFPSVVAWGTQSNLVVRFDPSALGARTAEITVASDDAEAGSYSFAVAGAGLADGAFIRVTGDSGTWITNGSTGVSAGLGTSFGSRYLTGDGASRNFWVTNSGNVEMQISGVNLGGAHPGDFEVLSFPATVAANSRTNLVVRFDPVATGARTAVVEIESDAVDAGTYAFTVGGTGLADMPAIRVQGIDGWTIHNGATTAYTWNGTHFGGAAVSAGTVERIFTITNSGVVDLVISNVTFEGAGSVNFSAPTVPAVVGPRSASDLAIRFSPVEAGYVGADVFIANNVAGSNPYRFAVRGFGTSTRFVWAGSPSPEAPYLTWETAAHTIQEATSISTDGDVVWVTNGVYDSGSVVHSGTNRVSITNAIWVQSVNGPEVTSIVGEPGMRCVYLDNGATLAGFTLTNGTATTGGGIYAPHSGAGVVSDCVIAGNQAVNGGGVHGATLYDCLIRGNVAQKGGGGVYGSSLHRCQLIGNQAGGSGASDTCPPGLTSEARYVQDGGGGAYASALYSCLLAGNTANGGGGAIRSTLRNCTLVENQALGFSYAGDNFGGGGMFGGAAVNCVFDGNVDLLTSATADVDGPKGLASCVYDNALYLSVTYSCMAAPTVMADPNAGAGNVTGRVTFVQGTYRLAQGSLGIDSGTAGIWIGDWDLNGQPRVVNGIVDMGAYEYQGPEPELPGYAGWAAGIANGLTNYHDCAAGDSYPNLLKYATGGSATQPDQTARMEPSGEDGVPRLLFRRNTNATDVILIVEGADAMDAAAVWRGIATNLAGIWNPPEVVEEEGAGNPMTCTVTDPEPLASNRFLRLKVELP